MNSVLIEKEINYDMSAGDKDLLFPVINCQGYQLGSFQFFIEALTGTPDGTLTVSLSNDGLHMKEFPDQVVLDKNGDDTYFMLGVGFQAFISCNFKKNGITGGVIKKVIFYGNQNTGL